MVWQDLLFCVSKNLKNCSENDVTNKSKISDEGGVFEYRAPKDQNKNHDESPIRLETPGSNVVITLVGVNHIRTYAHGTSYILKLGDFYGLSSQVKALVRSFKIFCRNNAATGNFTFRNNLKFKNRTTPQFSLCNSVRLRQ